MPAGDSCSLHFPEEEMDSEVTKQGQELNRPVSPSVSPPVIDEHRHTQAPGLDRSAHPLLRMFASPTCCPPTVWLAGGQGCV